MKKRIKRPGVSLRLWRWSLLPLLQEALPSSQYVQDRVTFCINELNSSGRICFCTVIPVRSQICNNFFLYNLACLAKKRSHNT